MPMPTMVDTAMAVTAMVDLATDTARGLLMPMPTMALTVLAMAMAVLAMDTARGLLMPMPTMAAMAMAAMAMVDSDTDMASGPLMLTWEAMAMVVLATDMAVMATASNSTYDDTFTCQILATIQNLHAQNPF